VEVGLDCCVRRQPRANRHEQRDDQLDQNNSWRHIIVADGGKGVKNRRLAVRRGRLRSYSCESTHARASNKASSGFDQKPKFHTGTSSARINAGPAKTQLEL
jgi:hypothetical protein